jgi:hypothetical protein
MDLTDMTRTHNTRAVMTQNTLSEPVPVETSSVGPNTDEVLSASEIYADLFRKYHPAAVPSGLGPAWSRPGYNRVEMVGQAA